MGDAHFGVETDFPSPLMPQHLPYILEPEFLNLESDTLPEMQDKSTADVSDLETGNTVTITPQVARLSSTIQIAADEEITAIRVFNMSGTEVASYSAHDYQVSIPLSELIFIKRESI